MYIHIFSLYYIVMMLYNIIQVNTMHIHIYYILVWRLTVNPGTHLREAVLVEKLKQELTFFDALEMYLHASTSFILQQS